MIGAHASFYFQGGLSHGTVTICYPRSNDMEKDHVIVSAFIWITDIDCCLYRISTFEVASICMTIDIHTHCFPPEVIAQREAFCLRDAWFAELYANPRARMATAEDLIASMQSNNVTQSVTFGFGWRDPGLIRMHNEYILAAISRYPGQLIGFAVVHPDDPDEIDRCARAGMSGVGELMPHGQGYHLNDAKRVQPMLDIIRAHDLVILSHTSEPIGHQYPGKGSIDLAEIVDFLTLTQDLRVILAHMGGGLSFYLHMPEIAAIVRNCWFDTAAAAYVYSPGAVHTLISSAGLDKVVWGSDYRVIGQRRMLKYIADANLSVNERHAILDGNARLLFRLPQ